MERLTAAHLTASISKSEFLIKTLNVLGHCVEIGEIKPSQRHVEKILQIKPQTTKKGVRALFGLINDHSDMIPNLAEVRNFSNVTNQTKIFTVSLRTD